MSTKVAKHQLKSIVERVERLEEERKNLAADIKEVYAEAKASGFDVKIIRKAVALRKKEPAVREEEEAILDLYLGALDMLPLFQMAEAPKTIAEQLREETHSTALAAVDSAGAGVAASAPPSAPDYGIPDFLRRNKQQAVA